MRLCHCGYLPFIPNKTATPRVNIDLGFSASIAMLNFALCTKYGDRK
jgi:hypothetical protein